VKVFVGNLYRGFVEGNCIGERIIDVKEGCPPTTMRRRGAKNNHCENGTGPASVGNDAEMVYHRRPIDCIALAGDTD